MRVRRPKACCLSPRAASWTQPRRVVAKVEWHPGEFYPRVGFIVTNLARPAERVVAFYNQRGTGEQRIKEGKSAIRWTRLSCRKFAHNAVRLQLHALAYNLGNFMRTLGRPLPSRRRKRYEQPKDLIISEGSEGSRSIGDPMARIGKGVGAAMSVPCSISFSSRTLVGGSSATGAMSRS